MARTDLTVNEASVDGNNITDLLATANVDGHAVENDGKTFVIVENTDAASRTVTLVTTKTVEGLAVADKAVVVAANKTLLIKLGPPSVYNQQSGTDKGKTYLDFSAVTNLAIVAGRWS